MAELEDLRRQYVDIANFLIIYIREAHPEDEWQTSENRERGIVYTQPKSLDERLRLANAFLNQMAIETPTLVDDIRNTANACYAAWPERIYVVDSSGKIAYKGRLGPYGFDPAEVREYLERNYGPGKGSD